jgi:putative ABC transport system ATP-binding protein
MAIADRARSTGQLAGGSILLREVRKLYGEGGLAVRALDWVDLEIAAGELVVVLGPSGSGKTTLLNVIGAIEPPSSGTVIVAGHDLHELDERARTEFRRANLGFVFQFFNLIPTLTALENVELIAELAGRGGAASAAALLREVGLVDRVEHFPAQLSGGEQQRVAVARALAGNPTLLLCDEPTGALDLETGRRVLALLREVNRASGRTVVLVTHNSAIARIADRVLRMRSGRIVEDARNPEPVPARELEW